MMSPPCALRASRRGTGLSRIAARGLALGCLAGSFAVAQETIRPSNTGAEAAAARDQVTLPQHYNLKIGPVTVETSASVGVEFNDNINLSENHRESDVIFRPEVRFGTEWRMSTLNTFRVAFGVGLAEYASHSDQNSRSILIDPGSEIGFDIFLGDIVRLNFHDRLSIVQNPIDEPTLSNVARFDRLQNSVGVTATVDLNQLKFVFGYDHFDYRSFNSEFDYLDHREEQFFASAGLRINDALVTGLDGSFALINYLKSFNNDGVQWSAGPFVEATLSPYVKLRLTAGAQGMSFDNNGTSGDTSDYDGWFGSLTAAQRLNQYWSHSLTVGHEAQLGLSTNFVDYTFARYVADWRMNSHIHFGIEGFVEDANESGGSAQNSEHSFRWGTGLAIGWIVNPKLTLALQYRYVNKDSDLVLRSYYQNSAILTVSYTF